MVPRNHPLLPLALLPMALPSMTGLASPNMFIMSPPSIQLQIDPTLQATVPFQVSSAPLPSSSIDVCASPQFTLHMSSNFTEQWVTKQRLREEQAAMQTRFCSFAKLSEDKTHYFGVCIGPGVLLALLSFCH